MKDKKLYIVISVVAVVIIAGLVLIFGESNENKDLNPIERIGAAMFNQTELTSVETETTLDFEIISESVPAFVNDVQLEFLSTINVEEEAGLITLNILYLNEESLSLDVYFNNEYAVVRIPYYDELIYVSIEDLTEFSGEMTGEDISYNNAEVPEELFTLTYGDGQLFNVSPYVDVIYNGLDTELTVEETKLELRDKSISTDKISMEINYELLVTLVEDILSVAVDDETLYDFISDKVTVLSEVYGESIEMTATREEFYQELQTGISEIQAEDNLMDTLDIMYTVYIDKDELIRGQDISYLIEDEMANMNFDIVQRINEVNGKTDFSEYEAAIGEGFDLMLALEDPTGTEIQKLTMAIMGGFMADSATNPLLSEIMNYSMMGY